MSKKTFTFYCDKPTGTLSNREYTGTLKSQYKYGYGDTLLSNTNSLEKATIFCISNDSGCTVNVKLDRFRTSGSR